MPAPYLSEIKYRGGAADDFAEVVVDAGTDVSNFQIVVYHPNGTIRSINGLGAIDNTQFGSEIYVVNTGIHMNGAVALVDNGTVISFVSFDAVLTPTVGPAAGMTSDQIGSTGNNQNQSLISTDGTSYTAGPITEGTIPCFVAGTRIATPLGERRVESLSIGDLISLADGGAAELLWCGSATVSVNSGARARLAPVLIPRNAFGPDLPKRNLLVSPQHRIRLTSVYNELHFGSSDVLIPAVHLIGWRGITQLTGTRIVTYHHLLFSSHQVILSEGLATESFLPGAATLPAFAEDTRAELEALFRNFAGPQAGNTRHLCLRGHETALALAG